METLLEKLPRELVEIIFKLSYQPQPPNLLEDIRSFVWTNEYLLNKYTSLYQGLNESATDWLDNDLHFYFNSGQAMNNGYHQRFYTILNRHFSIRDPGIFTNKLSSLCSKKACFIMMGLMTPVERNEFSEK